MGHYRFVVQVSAPREQVFDLWTNLDRAHEWIEGLTQVTDVTGPVTTAGTHYTIGLAIDPDMGAGRCTWPVTSFGAYLRLSPAD